MIFHRRLIMIYILVKLFAENHCILIDLRTKNITAKEAEFALGLADITVNKNMVPFDDKSPFVTSGIRIGTAAITTRGVNIDEIAVITDLIDQAITNHNNEDALKNIRHQVNELMTNKPLFKW